MVKITKWPIVKDIGHFLTKKKALRCNLIYGKPKRFCGVWTLCPNNAKKATLLIILTCLQMAPNFTGTLDMWPIHSVTDFLFFIPL